MSFSFPPWEIETILLCSIYDSRQGYFLLVFIPQLLLCIAVIVRFDRHIFIFNQLLLYTQFFQNILFNLLIYLPGAAFPPV